MRGVVYTGLSLVGVGALSAVTQQNVHGLPWSGSGLDTDELGTKFDDFVPFALFNLLPVLGVLIVMAIGALLAKGGRPSITSPFLFGFLGVGMILVGMLGGVLYPIDDLGLQGTVFEEGALVYIVYGAVLGIMGGVVYWAPKLWGRSFPDKQAMGLAGLGMIATVLASLPYYVAGFADQPAASPTYDYSGPAELWNVLVLVGHGLMLLTVLAFAGLAAKALRVRDADVRLRRCAGRRSVGRPDGRMDHHLAGTVRQLCRGARRLLGRARPRSQGIGAFVVTLALPAGPAPAPRRQIFVGTALACVAGTMLIGGQLAIWALIRDRAVQAGERFPGKFEIPEVAVERDVDHALRALLVRPVDGVLRQAR